MLFLPFRYIYHGGGGGGGGNGGGVGGGADWSRGKGDFQVQEEDIEFSVTHNMIPGAVKYYNGAGFGVSEVNTSSINAATMTLSLVYIE
ncbi:hypothetical protein DPMN_177625 [Dreissena polymorpha]|uniref:Uncharacterized protein n=1 Tax=Dreissena polymorpha TaxID=45954 RepID=A0A9D4EAJ9_DREPO|nr:hypothetical protein DPMN_177625 [Dreissena polymorpha]